MGSRERREREKEELRQKILDVARELFATNGYEQTTMRTIADRIEYSVTAIYSHFADKETLLRELCEEDFAELAARMETAMQAPSPAERLVRTGELYVDFAVCNPNHYRYMFMTRQSGGPDATAGRAAAPGAPQKCHAFIRRAVADLVAEGGVREEFRDADLLAQIVWSAMHGVVSLHLALGDVAWLNWRPVDELARMMTLALGVGVVAADDGSTPPPEGAGK